MVGAGTDLFLYSTSPRAADGVSGLFLASLQPRPSSAAFFNSLGCFGFHQILVESSPASSESVLRYDRCAPVILS
jgi:cytochrome c oxidase assembly protein Cox11